MGDSVKNLTEVQADNTHGSPIMYQASNFIIEVNHVGQARLLLGESMLTSPYDFLVFHVLPHMNMHLLSLMVFFHLSLQNISYHLENVFLIFCLEKYVQK